MLTSIILAAAAATILIKWLLFTRYKKNMISRDQMDANLITHLNDKRDSHEQ